MAFKKVTKMTGQGSRKVLESIRVNPDHKTITIPRNELSYIDSHNPGGGACQHIILEFDTSDKNHKIRITPTKNDSEFSITNRKSMACINSKAIEELQRGTYLRVDVLTYEWGGFED